MQDKWHLVFYSSKQQDTWLQKKRDQLIKQDSWPSSSIIWISDMLLNFSIIRWMPGVPSVPYFSFGNEKALSKYSCYPLQGLLQDFKCLRLCGSWVYLILQKDEALKMRTPPLTLKPLSSAEMKYLTSPGQRDIPWYYQTRLALAETSPQSCFWGWSGMSGILCSSRSPVTKGQMKGPPVQEGCRVPLALFHAA